LMGYPIARGLAGARSASLSERRGRAFEAPSEPCPLPAPWALARLGIARVGVLVTLRRGGGEAHLAPRSGAAQRHAVGAAAFARLEEARRDHLRGLHDEARAVLLEECADDGGLVCGLVLGLCMGRAARSARDSVGSQLLAAVHTHLVVAGYLLEPRADVST